jgi:hypothetical protein
MWSWWDTLFIEFATNNLTRDDSFEIQSWIATYLTTVEMDSDGCFEKTSLISRAR